MEKKNSIQYLSSGKYISERLPMIHQKRNLSSFVLLYAVKGTLFIADGGNEYELSPNQYLILAANREHVGIKPSPPGLSYYWCHFDIVCPYSLCTDETGREFLEIGGETPFRFPTYSAVQDPPKLHLLFHQLIDSSKASGQHTTYILNNFLGIILAEIAEQYNGTTPHNVPKIVENVLQWIKLNAPQIKGVCSIANSFGYNSEYLTTLIKKTTGQSLVFHVNESKITKACEILRMTDKTNKEIAYELGFADEKYFLRVFKKHKDVTPREYRNAYVKQHNNSI